MVKLEENLEIVVVNGLGLFIVPLNLEGPNN
jgi:hypothetical protein